MTFKPLVYEACLQTLLDIEGGQSGDAGGTAFGVTQETYDTWRRRKGLPLQPVSKITRVEASSIYYDFFWKPQNIPSLRPDFGLTLFIQSLNLPFREGAKILQAVMMLHGAYRGPIDGEVGAATIQATYAMSQGTVINALDGYAGHYAVDASNDEQRGLIGRRLQMIAEAVGRLPIEGE